MGVSFYSDPDYADPDYVQNSTATKMQLQSALAGQGEKMSNSAIVKQFITAMMSSDVETMTQCLNADIVWYPPTSVARHFHTEVRGFKSVIAFLTENPERFYEPGTRSAEILHLISEQNQVSLHFNFHAKPRIGGTLCTCANWVFEFAEGEIVAIWEILDMAEWNNAVLPSQ